MSRVVIRRQDQGTKKLNFPTCPNFLKKIPPNSFTCPLGKLRVKSTIPGLSDTNFFVRWYRYKDTQSRYLATFKWNIKKFTLSSLLYPLPYPLFGAFLLQNLMKPLNGYQQIQSWGITLQWLQWTSTHIWSRGNRNTPGHFMHYKLQ